MAFWTTYTTDPKRSFRYRFILGSNDLQNQIQEYTIKDVKKPSFQMEGGPQAKYIQHTFKYPGRVMWQDVNFTVIDPGSADEDASIALMNALVTSGYRVPTLQEQSVTSISKFNANKALGIPRIKEINADGLTTVEWSLHNAYITNVDFGQLSYETDELVSYGITIAYDFATIKNERTNLTVAPGIRTNG